MTTEEELEYLTKHSQDVCFNDDKNFISKSKIEGEWRHGTEYSIVTKSVESGIFYSSYYRVGSEASCSNFEDCNGKELSWKVYIPPITDTDLLNFLESQETEERLWIARKSSMGRGYRLYSGTSRDGFSTAREAIKDAMKNETI